MYETQDNVAFPTGKCRILCLGLWKNVSASWLFQDGEKPPTSYPPGNQHIPPGEEENHRLFQVPFTVGNM